MAKIAIVKQERTDNMHTDNIFEDNIEVIRDDDKLTKRIQSYKKIADESMTLIDDHKMEEAISNYHHLLGQIQLEAAEYQQADSTDLSPLALQYIEAINLLEENLPTESPEDTIYACHHNIFKALNNIN